MSPYRTLINDTIDTINRRARFYRNLVIAISLTGLASIGSAIGLWTFAPLTCLFLIFPLSGTFYLCDAVVVDGWRKRVLRQWTLREIDLSALNSAIRAHPSLPKGTLEGMLATLPAAGDFTTEHSISAKTREATTAIISAIHTCRADSLTMKLVAATVIALTITAASFLRDWHALAFVGAIAILPGIGIALRQLRLKKLASKTHILQTATEFDKKAFERLLSGLDWRPFSETGEQQ